MGSMSVTRCRLIIKTLKDRFSLQVCQPSRRNWRLRPGGEKEKGEPPRCCKGMKASCRLRPNDPEVLGESEVQQTLKIPEGQNPQQ